MQIWSRLTGRYRILRTARRLARRQVSARTGVRRAAAGVGSREPYVRITRGGVPVIARIDPELRLDRQRARLSERVTAALAAADVRFWWLPVASGAGPRLCVRDTDRMAAVAALTRAAEPSWYVDALTRRGAASGRWVPLRTVRGVGSGRLSRLLAIARGLLIWEFATPSPGSSFVASQQQALSLVFWTADEAGVLYSRVANTTATTLPEELCGDGAIPEPLRHRLVGAVDFPIDVVFTWVDGSDERWLLEKARVAGVADPEQFTERANDEVRFTDHDELRYSLRSVQQFAPWVRRVWIVTADQHPSWLDPDDPWVRVVSHRDIFPAAEDLPTFNSHAIESCLHRIEGLAEHFLYLNDDVFFGRPLVPAHFFHASGIGKCFSSRALVDLSPSYAGNVASETAAKRARELLTERYGVTLTQKFFHSAFPLSVSAMAALEAEFPEAFALTRRAQFRAVTDIAAAGSLYLNWGQITGHVVPGRLRYTYIDPAAPEAPARFERLLERRVFDTFCINDGSRLESLEQRRRTDLLIRSFLSRYLPVRGSFELPGR